MPGGTEWLIVLVLLVVLFVFGVGAGIFVVVDVARRDEEAFRSVGKSKTLWLVIPIVFAVLGMAWIPAIVYFVGVRPALPSTGPAT